MQYRKSALKSSSRIQQPVAYVCVRAATVALGVAGALVAPVFLLPGPREASVHADAMDAEPASIVVAARSDAPLPVQVNAQGSWRDRESGGRAVRLTARGRMEDGPGAAI